MRSGITFAVALAWFASGCGDVGPSSLEFSGVSPPQPQLGEIASGEFAAYDSRGLPAEGVLVSSSVEPQTGVDLLNESGRTDRGSGRARAQIRAAGGVASVVVIARAGPVGSEVTATSPPISFAG